MSIRSSSRPLAWLALLLCLSVAACGSPALSDADRIATRVAEDRAVARTLTAEAQASVPSPTDTPSPEPLTTVIVELPTPTPTPRQVVPTIPPAPTLQPTLVAIVPGFGSPNGLVGQIMLPGYSGPVNPPVFTDSIVFRLKVYDPDKGHQDGAGIVSVDMTITDPSGKTVHSRTERTAGYCVFGGGEPDCVIWNFHQHNNAWPDGTPVCSGDSYQANMNVHTADTNKDGAFWGFNFSIGGDYQPCG